jgi:hypothetical protein
MTMWTASSPMNERLEHRLRQRNRHTPQAQFLAGAMKSHAPGGRGMSRLFLHGRHDGSSVILNYPSCALSRAPLVRTDNIKASFRWKPHLS